MNLPLVLLSDQLLLPPPQSSAGVPSLTRISPPTVLTRTACYLITPYNSPLLYSFVVNEALKNDNVPGRTRKTQKQKQEQERGGGGGKKGPRV